jgi:hypothetical protein
MIESPDSIKTNPPVGLCSFFLTFCSRFFLDFCVSFLKLSVSCIPHHCLPSSLCCLPPVSPFSSSCQSIFSCLCFPFFLSVDLIDCLYSSIFLVNLFVCLSSSCLLLSFRFCLPSCILSLCLPSRLFISLSVCLFFLVQTLFYFPSLCLPSGLSIFILSPFSFPSLCLPSFLSIRLPTLSVFLCLFVSFLLLCLFPSISIFLPDSFSFPSCLSFSPSIFCVWGQNVTPPVSV